MHKIVYILIFLLFINFLGCKNSQPSARQPIRHNRQGVDMQSVEKNRNLNQREENYIKQMIAKDSLHTYIDSGHGFWFYYVKQNKKDTVFPKEGDKVLLQYEIRDLSNQLIYTFEEIGQKKYWVDHENYFRGFRAAVKLLKKGEEAVFLFPSGAAYGYHGDEKKIGTNIPLKVQLKIIEINKHKTP